MQGNIQIEVLNEGLVIVDTHLKDVSNTDKQLLVMSLARNLDLTPADVLTASLAYPDFLSKKDLYNNRSTPDL